jgi:phage gpG-like protein
MSKFGFDKVLRNMQEVKKQLPTVLANQAQTFFTHSFDKQGFEEGKDPWQEVKRRQEGTSEYKYPKYKGLGRRTKAILSGSGRLKRAVASSVRQATWDLIRLIVDVPYADIHNKGGEGKAFGKHAFKMPKREFMGDSSILRKMQKDKIKQVIDKIWRA